jgi:hypothetical protein
MWAYLADILTFYQERIANEAYLRTAIFRASVKRLAALLDYEPASGVAATAKVTFTLEEDATVKISPGLRIQSVPGQDEAPQKFETVESLEADAQLNRFRIFPRPQSTNPLARGRTSATTLGNVDHLSAGDKIVIYMPTSTPPSSGGGSGGSGTSTEVFSLLADTTLSSATLELIAEMFADTFIPPDFFDPGMVTVSECADNARHVEDKEVTGVETVDWRRELRWTPAVRCAFDNQARIQKWTRKLRLFGRNAPAQLHYVTVDDKENVHWHQEKYEPCQKAGNKLNLDAVYDDLKVGTQLLLVTELCKGDAAVQVLTVTAVEQAKATITPKGKNEPVVQEATVTRVTLAETLPGDVDARTAVLYELEGAPLDLWRKRYAEALSGNAVYVPLAELGLIEGQADIILQRLSPGRRLLFEDRNGLTHETQLKEARLVEKHLELLLMDGISEPLDTQSAYCWGNAALATHGETVSGEVLGSGNAATTFQSFTLRKAPVTFVPDPGAEHGAANTLDVRVNEILWHEVDTLFDKSRDARVYTTSVDDEGKLHVQFGNGQMGARLPSGQDNIVATYRKGLGLSGNVAAGTLTTLLDKPAGLQEVTNLAPAEGGANRESRDEARENAPNKVRTFDRIVSLRDFEDAARGFSGVTKARATWHWNGMERVVRLTVTGDAGARIEEGSETHRNLVAHLDSQRDPNRRLKVISYHPVPVQITTTVRVHEDYLVEEVRAAVRDAVEGFLAYESVALGQPVHLSDLYEVIQTVEGVVAADINRLQYKDEADRKRHAALPLPVLAHLAISATELVMLTTPARDLVINVGLEGNV